jgi:hypothetical protein
MNINNLYEAVPVTNANIPEPGSRLHVLTKDGQKAVYIFTGSDMSVITMKEQYSHYLRPVTRESIEAFLREFGEKVATKMQDSIIDNASYDSEEEIIEIDYSCIEKDKQTAITELITQTLGQ